MSNVAPAKIAMAFFDGQNLYRHAKDAFGHHHPNYDPVKLHSAVCAAHGWRSNLIRFYTGVPDARRDPVWAGYWNNRVLAMKRAGINVTTRKIRYHDEQVTIDGATTTVSSSREKGIDIRIALDLVACARRSEFDVAVLFSQDQDLHEVVAEVRDIARCQNRQIEICCAFPSGENASSKRGIDKTNWFRIERSLYDACLDSHDYRPRDS
ncbi:NYN domain-containing protein [Aureimonas altamirensis]|uniref:NYN domain-containing protein n=1 Tax=Aureimonas altamirensis TaxID=370622 RepID=UPI002036DDFE|nr:NYN domain-containing protein [Aureimonas altamirensis]MCM2503464.1 NYN domain-containing protein [Aureimonas altamirensis]